MGPRVVLKVRRLLASSAFAQGGLAFFVATGAVSLSNFVFHVVISRLLGPANYGALGALLNLMLVLSVPLGALSAAVTQAEASRRHAGRAGINMAGTVMRAALFGAAVTVGLIVSSPLIAGFLHFGSIWSVVVLAAWIVPAVIGAVFQGVLMGRLRFTPVALASFVGLGLGRLLFGVVFVELGGGVVAALVGSVVGQVLATVIVAIAVRHDFKSRREEARGIDLRESVLSVCALAGFWVLGSEDTVLVRHFLPPHGAGLYAAAATAGRIALFLPGAIAMIAFPRFSRDKGHGESSREALRWSLVGTALLSFGAAVAMFAFPSLLIEILFGSKYLGATGALRILGFEAAGLGIVGLLIYYQLARESLQSLYGWAGAALAFVGVELFHSSLISVALDMLVSVSVVVVVLLMSTIHGVLGEPLVPVATLAGGEGGTREADFECDLSLVVPYYNPGSVLAQHVTSLAEVLTRGKVSFEIIAVSDGSTDGSSRCLDGVLPGVLRSVEYSHNYGKGQALRVGMSQGKGRYLGFIDADGDIPADQLLSFLDAVKGDGPDIVTGSKRHPDSDVFYPPLRRVYSWGYQQLIRFLFHLSVRDTQTGIKLIRSDVVREALPLMVEKRFAFDLELFVVSRHLGFNRIVELPVHIERRFASTVSIKAVNGMMLDTFGIFYRLHFLHYYDRHVQRQGGVVNLQVES